MGGGFSVSNATLNRFYSLHYLLPFILAALAAVHLICLHEDGSNNPIGVQSEIDKVPFHVYYSTKDIFGIVVMVLLLTSIVFLSPNLLGDPENFIQANPLVTPVHIQPEWYFLFAYAILRSIPNKLGGVVALAASVAVLYTLGFAGRYKIKGTAFRPLARLAFWFMAADFMLL